MPVHAEKRILPYTAREVYDLVADIESYPEFLPWCTAARVRRRTQDTIHADLVITFKMFRERFGSKVTLNPPEAIEVRYLDGPFRYLENQWRFRDRPEGGCLIDFYVDFEFRSRVLQKVIEVLFSEAVRRLVGAFEKRAQELYGPREGPRGTVSASPQLKSATG
jgi:coenzyme Q-binding protein COQ10